jgi:hypothetical protein
MLELRLLTAYNIMQVVFSVLSIYVHYIGIPRCSAREAIRAWTMKQHLCTVPGKI